MAMNCLVRNRFLAYNVVMNYLKKSIIFLLVFGFFIPGQSVWAVVFNNGYIISDSDLTDSGAMTFGEIQNFLERRNGALGGYFALDKNGVNKSAAEIIWQAAQDYTINPKFLLVMLQKEQSLVEDGSASPKQYDWAMGYGVCDSCDLNDPALSLFKGFGTQVDRAAWRNRWYINNSESWLKQPGHMYKIDGHDIFIVNQATANLYNYTPHIHGNYVFWQIWNRWFTQKYPDGSLLQAEGEAGVWLIADGLRRPFFSKGALVSRYNIENIISVSKTELEKYEIGRPIKFPNYSLLQTPMGNVYLLIDDRLRKFESDNVWRTIGYNPEEFEVLNLAEFDQYELGEPITMKSAYPMGALLQDKITGGVFFVQDGKKYPIITKDILKINYPKYHLTAVSPAELDKFERQDPIKIKNGALVKAVNHPTVYVISDGLKRPIVSGDVFERLGYKWENVKLVDPRSLVDIPLGGYVDLDFKQ